MLAPEEPTRDKEGSLRAREAGLPRVGPLCPPGINGPRSTTAAKLQPIHSPLELTQKSGMFLFSEWTHDSNLFV